jgi:hypothetical protein
MIANDRDASGKTLPVGSRTVTLKLIPLVSVRSALDSVRTRVVRPISGFAMDGPRVAYAVRDPRGLCDTVRLWNVPWNVGARITRSSGPTCLPTHSPGGITDVAIAGTRAAWTTVYGGTTRVLAASSKACEEWVVTRPASSERVVGLTGDGKVLAYALAATSARNATTGVAVVSPSWRGLRITRLQHRVVSLSVYEQRIAALDTRGNVSITRPGGKAVAEIRVGPARAIALRRSVVVTLGNHGSLSVYSIASGRRVGSWRIAPTATSLDVEFETAVITAGRDVYAVNLRTGRTARVYRAPASVTAEIESPGVVVQYNLAGRGHLDFLPMAEVEARTR